LFCFKISLLRPNDIISVAVKLSSYVADRCRYLVIVETQSLSNSGGEESAILGVDLHLAENNSSDNNNQNIQCTIGLVLPIYASCMISLNGDGGFKFQSHESVHIFKPVSIQAMWSAYQYLHKAFENARKENYYSSNDNENNNNNNECICAHHLLSTTSTSSLPANLNSSSVPVDSASPQSCTYCGKISVAASDSVSMTSTNSLNHRWIKYYTRLAKLHAESNATSTSTINEWYQKEERSAQREDFTTPYFDGASQLTKEQEEIGACIKEKLKEIMISTKDDYGSMSSIHIRGILEKELGMNLNDFKKFIDVTIFQFYNQLIECASQIMPYLQLGTEWNASNYDTLVADQVTHILNVSSEVDNFFPDTFKYLNVRVLDVNETELVKEFDRTNRFIAEAKEQGTCCLVHCKMGVSRSASCVIAFLMKEYNWSLEQAYQHTKQKRTCINPNDGFRHQLLTYESILNAHRSKYVIFDPLVSPPTSTTSTTLPINIQQDTGPSVKEAINKISSSFGNNNSLLSTCSLPEETTLISNELYISNKYNNKISTTPPSPPPHPPTSSHNNQKCEQVG
jgi:protein-tyrosine phosphatase